MKLRPCLIIRCIVSNTIDSQQLLLELNKYINNHFFNAHICSIMNEPYWKYPEYNEIVYQLCSHQCIAVAEFIRCLALSWYHTTSSQEEAIWSKFCHPEEFFLISEVKWVHIYIWEEDEFYDYPT